MRRYALATNYIHLINKDKNKGETIYIDGRPKASDNIAEFINNTRTGTTKKQPNCKYEGREENQVVLCAIKKIAPGEELLVDYHLN
jgi:SET domain-containing protein